MSHSEVTKDIVAYTAQRVTLTSSKPIQDVLAALDQELNKAGAGFEMLKLLQTTRTKSDLEEGMQRITEGTRDFVYFTAGSHTKWLSAYFEGARRFPETYVYTIGNPLIAQTMLQHDLQAGLHIPPKILVQELEDGRGSRIVYDLPSSTMTFRGNEELKKAAEVLDEKLENMTRKVLA